MEQMQNGGVQYVPPIAVQYIYLDFDGELTSYNGEILSLENVEVKHSNLTADRIADIVAELNTKYADSNVIFVTERPTNAEYSTIYIGKTDAFNTYGNFTGLAETIDKGNKNTTDNAFVMLDASATNLEIVSTISHEADHLLGTLDHGGEGLNAYAANTTIEAGTTSTGLTVFSGNSLTVWGTANSITMSGGDMQISSGGVANFTTVKSRSYMQIKGGGTGSGITVLAGGDLYVSDGGYAFEIKEDGGYVWVANDKNVSFIPNTIRNLVLSGAGNATLHSGTVAENTTVSSGKLYIYSSGLHRGSLQIASGAVVSAYGGSLIDFTLADRTAEDGYLINDLSRIIGNPTYTITVSADQTSGTYKLAQGAANFSGSITIGDGTTNYGSLTVNGNVLKYNNTPYSLTQSEGNLLLVVQEREPSVFVYSSGRMTSAGSEIIGAVLSHGGNNSMHVSSGGTANRTTVNYAGNMYISCGGTANSTYVHSVGVLWILSGGVANSTIVYRGGDTSICSGGSANATKVYSGGFMTICSGGVANSTTVYSGGSMYIARGGTVSLAFNPWQYGYIRSESGATVEYLERDANIYLGGYASGLLSKCNSCSDVVVSSGLSMIVYASGVANCTAVDNGGSITISSGGTANATTVNVDGSMHIFSGGTASIAFNPWQGYIHSEGGATVEYLERDANIYIGGLPYIGGVASGLLSKCNSCSDFIISSGLSIIVYAGGVANRTTVNYLGAMSVSSGGTATSTTVNGAGFMHINNGGVADCTTVNSGGEMTIFGGGSANRTAVQFGGSMHIFSGGVANSTIVAGGSIDIFSGGEANNTVNSAGFLRLSSGGVANNTTVYDGGYLTIYGGVANDTTVNSTGSVYIGNGGTANRITVNAQGWMTIFSGGTAIEIKENGGAVEVENGANVIFASNTINALALYGSMTVHSNTVAVSTTVNSLGTMTVSSGGTANETTINTYGSMVISRGGTADSTNVNESGFIDIYNGGVASNISVNSHGRVDIYSGGMASRTNVDFQGKLCILNGGSAVEIIENGGEVHVADGAHATFASNTIEGLILSTSECVTVHQNTVANGTIMSGGDMTIYSGGVANKTIVSAGYKNFDLYHGMINISSGGFVNSTTVESGGWMYLFGGSANNTSVNSEGFMIISSGGTANSTTVNSGGYMDIISGGTVTNITASSGAILYITVASNTYIQGTYARSAFEMKDARISGYNIMAGGMTISSGGVANDTTVNSGGYMDISNGGVHKGTLQIASGGVVSACAGAVIDFTVSSRTVSDGYLINDLSRISGALTYTITVSANQTFGTYKLAQGAYNFSGNITVSDGTTIYGMVSVNGESITYNEVDYQLTQENGNLHLAVYDLTPPTAPVASADITAATNRDVTVTAVFSDDSAIREYSFDNQNWYTYTSGIVISANGDIYFRAADAAGNISEVTKITVNNIDKVAPLAPVVALQTITEDRQELILNVTYSVDSVARQYSLDQVNWLDYSQSIAVENFQTYYFRAADAADNFCDTVQYSTADYRVKTFSSGTLADHGSSIDSIILSKNDVNAMYISNGGVANCTTVNSNGHMHISNGGVASETTVSSGGSMTIYGGGVASDTTVSSGGLVTVLSGGSVCDVVVSSAAVLNLREGAYADGVSICRYGSMTVAEGNTIRNLNVLSRAQVTLSNVSAYAVTIHSAGLLTCLNDVDKSMFISGAEILSNGKIIMSSGAQIYDACVSKAGTLHLENGGNAYNTLIREEGVFSMLGVAENTTLHGGSMYVGDSSYRNYDGTGGNPTSNVYDEDIHASNNVLNSSWLHVYSGGTATSNMVNSNSWLHVYYGGTATSNVINSSGYLTVQDSGTADTAILHSGGFMRLYTGAILKGEINVGGKVTVSSAGTSATEDVIRAYGAQIDYLVSERTTGDQSIISNLGMIMGATYYATVKVNQASGQYKLADGATDFDGSITVRAQDKTIFGTISVNGGAVTYNGVSYSLVLNNDTLLLAISGNSQIKPELYGNSDGVSFYNIPGDTYQVELSRNNFQTVLQLETANTSVDFYGMSAGTYQWEVNDVKGDNIVSNNAASSQKFISDADGNLDLFFGNADSVWENGYAAEHQGVLNGWNGTGEQVELSGKNRIDDVFAGSTDANILVLTDSANGDALFVDDIYTALGNQTRLSQINEIRAGYGDDIVDMTSQQFTYEGDGVTIYGGAGNDTIWANCGNNTLFGDAGNDRLVGGTGNDYIIGGAGNDAMHGGGGVDSFCFSGNWGNDTVEQIAGGTVILWIADGSDRYWNKETLTYSYGSNSITVSGVTNGNVILRYYADPSLPEGAFTDAASEKIFEDKNKGMIA